jgi:murein DD-endopeptidase MepM/ murein hydrolase activator NlpD
MTHNVSKAELYPKSHILAASGIAALLSLALLVFPSREVEAKRTSLDLELTAPTPAAPEENGVALPDNATEQPSATSPFAEIETPDANPNAAAEAAAPAESESEPASVASEAPTDPLLKVVTVGNGDTLSTLFAEVGLSSSVLHDVLGSGKEAKTLGRLKVGQSLEFKLSPEGQLASLQVQLSEMERISFARSDSGYAFKRELAKPDVRSVYAHGVIDSSLFLSAQRAGLSHKLTTDLANIFAYDIDFGQDLREGDEFEVIYEEKALDGKRVGTGSILAARFVNRGKTFSAIRYTNKQGSSSYYTADGNSMRKAFIRTPVDVARISSRFSMSRKHPVLNKIRAHKGVDYAAPRGTPIKAAGDGRVLLAGRKGGYGNTVVIQHNQRYQTLYGHMQGFAKGIRNGVAVKQGQVIGYIGTTGLSTGPHLHYEFQVDGTQVDPLSIKMALADSISGAEKQRFLQLSKPLIARMEQEKATMLALDSKR